MTVIEFVFAHPSDLDPRQADALCRSLHGQLRRRQLAQVARTPAAAAHRCVVVERRRKFDAPGRHGYAAYFLGLEEPR